MKRLLVLIIALVLILPLAGCRDYITIPIKRARTSYRNISYRDNC